MANPTEPLNPAALSAYSPVSIDALSSLFPSLSDIMNADTSSSLSTLLGQGATNAKGWTLPDFSSPNSTVVYQGYNEPASITYQANDKSGPGYQDTTFTFNPSTGMYMPSSQMGSSNKPSLGYNLLGSLITAAGAGIAGGGALGLLGPGTAGPGAAALGGSTAGDVAAAGGLSAAAPAASAGSMTFDPSGMADQIANTAATNVAPQLSSDLSNIIATAGPGSAAANALGAGTGGLSLNNVGSIINGAGKLLGGGKGGLGPALGGLGLGALLSGGSNPPNVTSGGAANTTLGASAPFNYTPRPDTWTQFMNKTQPANNPWANPAMAAMLGINPGDVGLRSFGNTGGQVPTSVPSSAPPVTTPIPSGLPIRPLSGFTPRPVGFADGGSASEEQNPLTVLQGLTGLGNPFGTKGDSATVPFWQRLSPGVMRGHGPVAFSHGGLSGGNAGGQADTIDAKLSDGEYVMDADVVSALGDGNNNAGAKKLDAFREAIRAHKRSAPNDKIPPKAKPLGHYLSKR